MAFSVPFISTRENRASRVRGRVRFSMQTDTAKGKSKNGRSAMQNRGQAIKRPRKFGVVGRGKGRY